LVKYVSDKTGRFSLRPHYEANELDLECEKIVTAFLRKINGSATPHISTNDLTKLIEHEADELDLYADLSEYGPNVEGVTEFRLGRKPIVKIDKKLAEAENRQNRLRTTLCHEYGHVHFHAYLWELEPPKADVLIRDPTRNRIISKSESMLAAPQKDWLEWQAGYVSGAILMPLTHVRRLVRAYQQTHNIIENINSDSEHGRAMIRALMDAFEVSEDAARVRLTKLNFIRYRASQPSLFG
jgi:hypothetical protein